MQCRNVPVKIIPVFFSRLERVICLFIFLFISVESTIYPPSPILRHQQSKDYPGYQRFFSRAVGIFGVGRSRARKVSAPQGIKRLAPINEARIPFWEIRRPFCLHVTSMMKHNFLLGFATGSPMMIATTNTIVKLLHCSIFRRLSFVWLSSPSQSMNYAHY